jgi:hypothetical protein
MWYSPHEAIMLARAYEQRKHIAASDPGPGHGAVLHWLLCFQGRVFRVRPSSGPYCLRRVGQVNAPGLDSYPSPPYCRRDGAASGGRSLLQL